MLIVKSPGLSFACKIPLVMQGIKIPRVELRRIERNTTSRLIRVFGVELFKLCLDVVGLKHLRRLDVDMTMFFFTAFVVLGFMDYKSPKAKPASFEKLVKFMSDGTVAAAVYAESVHYRSDGEWKEIDNSLIDGGETLHTSGESGFYASFRKDAYTGALVGISYEDVKLSWTVQVVGKNGIVTGLSKDTEAARVRASDPGAEAYAAKNVTSAVKYSKAFDTAGNIDLRYTVSQHKVEEDVILNRFSDFSAIRFVYYCGDGLTGVLKDDNRIAFIDGNGETKFNVAAPYMYDSKGETTNSFKIGIKNEGGICTVTVYPDSAWLASPERAYPVVIDPSVTTSQYASNYYDTYVHESDAAGDHVNETSMRVGVYSSQINRALIKIKSYPSVPTTATIVYASLRLRLVNGTSTGCNMTLKRCRTSWDESTVCYSNQPIASNIQSNVPCDFINQKVEFDITGYFNSYRNGNLSNYGFVVTYTNEAPSPSDYNCFYTSEYTNGSYRPLITVLYNLQSESESNNSISLANRIEISDFCGVTSVIRGVLSSTSDVDYYYIEAPRHGRIHVELVFPDGYAYRLNLYESDGSTLNSTVYGSPDNGTARTFVATRGTETDGTLLKYYFKVSSYPEGVYVGSDLLGGVSAECYYLHVWYSTSYADLNWTYPLPSTVNRVTSSVGYRGYNGGGYHQGIDLGASTGTPVYAPCDGVVCYMVNSGTETSIGWVIYIRSNKTDEITGKNYIARCMHLSSILYEQDDYVEQGDLIAYSGASGGVAAHLHFDVSDNNITQYYPSSCGYDGLKEFVNPVDFFYDDIAFYGYIYY